MIAAAVIGGTSFAGGIGTIPGAVLGALVMQSLAYGLSFIGLSSPIQDIVAGHRAGRRRGLDTINRRRARTKRRIDATMTDSRAMPLVEMRDIRVAFGGVHAVDGVTIDLYPGEVVGLVGGNGAGKTTLIRTLSGAHPADSGEILIDGEPVTITQPARREGLGIETIYQTLALADNIDAPGEHVPRAGDHHAFGNLDDSAMEDATRKLMGRLNPKFRTS